MHKEVKYKLFTKLCYFCWIQQALYIAEKMYSRETKTG